MQIIIAFNNLFTYLTQSMQIIIPFNNLFTYSEQNDVTLNRMTLLY